MHDTPLFVGYWCYGSAQEPLADPIESAGRAEYHAAGLAALRHWQETFGITHVRLYGSQLDSLGSTEAQGSLAFLKKTAERIEIPNLLEEIPWDFDPSGATTGVDVVAAFVKAAAEEFPGNRLVLVCDEVRADFIRYALGIALEHASQPQTPEEILKTVYPIRRPDSAPTSNAAEQKRFLEILAETRDFAAYKKRLGK